MSHTFRRHATRIVYSSVYRRRWPLTGPPGAVAGDHAAIKPPSANETGTETETAARWAVLPSDSGRHRLGGDAPSAAAAVVRPGGQGTDVAGYHRRVWAYPPAAGLTGDQLGTVRGDESCAAGCAGGCASSTTACPRGLPSRCECAGFFAGDQAAAQTSASAPVEEILR